jgi:hypothetical protein
MQSPKPLKIISWAVASAALFGCAGSTSTGGSSLHDAGPTGGSTGNGGSTSAGGSPSSGGSPTAGGAPGRGGIPSSGGSAGSGGLPASGGVPGSGGVPSMCSTSTCSNPFACCGNACVYLQNDPHHCGGCNTACPAATPLCSQGKCIVAACNASAPPACRAGGPSCCGTSCCTGNEICCEVEGGGPAPPTPPLGCFDPSKSGGTCPRGCPLCVCASPDTPIATPDGNRAIASLHVGDRVLSVDHGRVVDVPILEVHTTPVRQHHVVQVQLASGSVLEISAGHPTADGRTFGDIRAGESLGGVTVRHTTLIPYGHPFTYDILPTSDSGTYFAGGVLIGSTLGGDALTSKGIDYATVTLPAGP